MTDPVMSWAVGFATGLVFGARICWILTKPRDRDPDWRRSFNHENTNRPSGPPPLKFRRNTRSIWFPDPDSSRRPTNPYSGKPVQSNPPPRNP